MLSAFWRKSINIYQTTLCHIPEDYFINPTTITSNKPAGYNVINFDKVLLYADGLNLFGNKINIIKKNAEAMTCS
jgi:hypothetical protein